MEHKTIKLLKYRGDGSESFTGRPEGKSARRDAKLNNADNDKNIYEVEIPLKTKAFNPSFFLGFFFDSIKKLGIEKFDEKYQIKILEKDKSLIAQLNNDISEGRRHAINQLGSNGGLLKFLK